MMRDVGAFDARYAVLDELPQGLYDAVVVGRHGELRERARAVVQLRRALLEGRWVGVEELSWPQEPLRGKVLGELGRLQIARFCRGQAEAVDAVLESVLGAAASFEGAMERARARRVEDWGRELLDVSEGRVVVDEGRAIQMEREREAAREASEDAAALLELRWGDRAELLAKLEEVFGELSQELGRGWDLSRGMMRSKLLAELGELREVLARLPQIRELVETLGRLKASQRERVSRGDGGIAQRMRRASVVEEEVRTRHAPMEARGIHRSGDVSRMLPSEAALLGHESLRLLWHARRAEALLVTYRVEGVMPDHALREEDFDERGGQGEEPMGLERGPVVCCLDTSGSMHGAPEQIAKALVLELLRLAHEEGRGCYLYAFSGPGEVQEHELSLGDEGLGELEAFLSCRFEGGTHVEAPLLRAAAKLREEAWSQADMLVVTDGAFWVDPKLRQELEEASKQRGLRVHGLLIGAQEAPGFEAMCDVMHRAGDWSGLLADSPGR